jgi:hypothetical protein
MVPEGDSDGDCDFYAEKADSETWLIDGDPDGNSDGTTEGDPDGVPDGDADGARREIPGWRP